MGFPFPHLLPSFAQVPHLFNADSVAVMTSNTMTIRVTIHAHSSKG
jgi:hypothetical protein